MSILKNNTPIRVSLLFCAGALLLFGGELGTSEARAGSWAFRRSYYSHDLPPEVAARYPRPRSRSAYRRPYVYLTPGYAVRGGYRINRIYTRNGNSVDVQVYQEDWFDHRP